MKCNKLKAYKMIDEKYCDDSFCVVPSDVYLKSEADEELAKLNRQVKFLQTTHSSCNNLLEHTTEVINSQERVIHRQKYKRCLALAKLCRSEWAAAIFIPEKCLGDNHAKIYMRWEKRWLNIAAQFKDAK